MNRQGICSGWEGCSCGLQRECVFCEELLRGGLAAEWGGKWEKGTSSRRNGRGRGEGSGWGKERVGERKRLGGGKESVGWKGLGGGKRLGEGSGWGEEMGRGREAVGGREGVGGGKRLWVTWIYARRGGLFFMMSPVFSHSGQIAH